MKHKVLITFLIFFDAPANAIRFSIHHSVHATANNTNQRPESQEVVEERLPIQRGSKRELEHRNARLKRAINELQRRFD